MQDSPSVALIISTVEYILLMTFAYTNIIEYETYIIMLSLTYVSRSIPVSKQNVPSINTFQQKIYQVSDCHSD